MPLPILSARFESQEAYRRREPMAYALLPFRFLHLDSNRSILSTFAGEYVVLQRPELGSLGRHELAPHSTLDRELQSRHFLIHDGSSVALALLAAKFRTKYAFLSQFTSLFIFVTTLRCEHSCRYCQVS